MEDLVEIVYRGPDDVKLFPGALLLFTKDVPQKVSRKMADALIGNNPTLEQAAAHGYCDVFEILDSRGGD